ncbi:unnamed protein product [Cylicocyclus nassatus]|uniref:Uncharacterized protein n=1 Tax=Cylicocyclus nassatus TaxID=53992 RepID=A0AA36GLZ8_CYLNA|nr:unnamed protein product [Cylicocyclus nassatus]
MIKALIAFNKFIEQRLEPDTRQRSSQPLTETESSPRKRPRVSSPMEDVPGESKPFVLVILPYAMHCRLDQKLCIGLRDGKVSSEEGDIVSLVLQASLFSSLKQFDRPPMDNDEGLVQHIVSL